jgi:hypothetical protein
MSLIVKALALTVAIEWGGRLFLTRGANLMVPSNSLAWLVLAVAISPCSR